MYQERIEKVLAAMEDMGLEQMLVSNPNSIWYLTGYYVFPYERMLALYLRRDGNHILFLNRLFPEPEAPTSAYFLPASMRRFTSFSTGFPSS